MRACPSRTEYLRHQHRGINPLQLPPTPRASQDMITPCTIDLTQPSPSPPPPCSSPIVSRKAIRSPRPTPPTPPLPNRRSTSTPRKIKSEPESTPLFSSTPLLPPSTYTRPGQMVIEPRRLVSQACTRYILPDNCYEDSNRQGWKDARMAFIREKRRELKSNGLIVEKKVILREDGLVLEWTSPVPVWTDTFLPERGRDLVSAINETSIGNARLAARSSKRTRSNSASTSASASRLTSVPTSASIVELDDSPASPRPARGPKALLMPPPEPPLSPAVPEPEPEPEPVADLEPPPKVVRPSQVVPPNPHPPKRTFKPVHVPRAGTATANPSSDPSGTAGKGKGDNLDEGPREATPARVSPPNVLVLPEPVQPTPVPSPAPAPVPAPVEEATNEAGDVFMDGGLESRRNHHPLRWPQKPIRRWKGISSARSSTIRPSRVLMRHLRCKSTSSNRKSKNPLT
ncbi:hypothetical protein FA13DRAFT_1083500 [Coprinellus micaceus]|uniref:Uncharacterized protein n=1 Tax=Coprinellus micaceus TaxID=71717 RepID=A0A4Y7TRG0_COPMI|nr:hypothetical protein FA13DRAFT_1083500 [Coprinellus micaceus]